MTLTGLLLMGYWGYSQWNQLGNDINGLGNTTLYGHAVSISDDGTRVAVGGATQFQ